MTRYSVEPRRSNWAVYDEETGIKVNTFISKDEALEEARRLNKRKKMVNKTVLYIETQISDFENAEYIETLMSIGKELCNMAEHAVEAQKKPEARF